MKTISQTLTILAALFVMITACDRENPTQPASSQRSSPPAPAMDVTQGSCTYGKVIPSTGNIKLGVVRVCFQNLALPAWATDAAIEGVLFTNQSNIRDLYREMSYNQLDFSYTMLGQVNLAQDWTGDCGGSTWACSVLDNLHQSLGDQTFNTYDMFVLTVPTDNPCDSRFLQDARSAVYYVPTGTTSLNPYVYAHEIGHAWWHHAARAGDAYGDRSDIMGGNGVGAIAGLRQTNAPHKINANWLAPAALMTVGEINNNGWNEIGPLTRPYTTRPLAIEIPVRNDPSSFYTVSYRIATGYDALLANPDQTGTLYSNILTIHKGHPATPPAIETSELIDFVPAGNGIIYVSPGNEFQIRSVSLDDTKARFKVILGSTDFTAPSTPVISYTTNCTGAHVTWTASVDGAGGSGFDHYQVRYGLWTTGSYTYDPPTTSLYRDFSISAGGQLDVQVLAYDAAGNFSTASAWIYMPPATTPSTPSNLTASAPHQWVTLSWTASSDPCSAIDYYEVERQDAGLMGTTANPVFDDDTTVQLTTYSYRVRARNVAGVYSAWTSWYRVTTGPDIGIQ